MFRWTNVPVIMNSMINGFKIIFFAVTSSVKLTSVSFPLDAKIPIPVSYTHLDVYKRQIITRRNTSAEFLSVMGLKVLFCGD